MASKRKEIPKAKRQRSQKSGSVSSADGSSSKAVSELERVKYALKNTSDNVIVRLIRQSVDHSDKRLPSLSAVFDKRVFPPPVEVLSKCARCEVEFDPNYVRNSKRSCKVFHDPDNWDYQSKYYSRRKGLRYNWSCTKCNKRWQLSGLDADFSDEDDAICYIGRHTVDLEESDSSSESSSSEREVSAKKRKVSFSESDSSIDSDDVLSPFYSDSDSEASGFW